MFTKEIAELIKGVSYKHLPSAAIDAAKMAILDCLGVTLAGCNEMSSSIICQYTKRISQSADAGIIGRGFKTSVEQAAWVNGTQAHALDYDDYFALSCLTPYHPTAPILPAVLAVAEKDHLSGRDVLLAYITGFEVEAIIAKVCVRQQYDLGWHTTSTLGSLGAAAAVAKILKLDEEKSRIALGIASSLAGGLRRNFGTMTKPLHAGNAARNGAVAAMLAQSGFTADRDILDSPLSFCEVLSGETKPLAEVPDMNLGVRPEFYIISPGIAFKSYPPCACSHWAIDAALDLKRGNTIAPRDIVDIECRTSSGLPRILVHSRPTTALEGKFSIEFCVAIALIDGEVSLKQFSDRIVRDSAVQELIQKVRYVHPPEMGSGLNNLKGEIVVRLKNGKVYSRRVNIARGDPRNPLNKDEVISKYRDCVSLSLSPEDTDMSLNIISRLESINDITELMDILVFGTARVQ